MPHITVLGAGLAGCEAALQCARRGVDVTLIEQKPVQRTPAHHADGYAELCCSNSLRSDLQTNAAGLLKAEMACMGSAVIAAARETAVPAGSALAVDRDLFSERITAAIHAHPRIRVETARVDAVPRGTDVLVATGPLTDGALAADIIQLTGSDALSFYDASAPLVDFQSINPEKTFFAARYGKGNADYINCPMNEDEYRAFWHALTTAETADIHGFEKDNVFEGCMPIEVMAMRGEDGLRFGPLRPVGLTDPRTGRRPYAVVQLRRDNAAGSVYNLVGFQTHLKFPAQKRVFSMIPGLENAEFLRYGVMHRNTFLDSPRLLDAFYRLRTDPRVRFAGQLTGVEGYVESAASGLYAGAAAAIQLLTGTLPAPLPVSTATGALAAYVSNPLAKDFQPMNINFGIIASDGVRIRDKRLRLEAVAAAALRAVRASAFAAESIEHPGAF